MAKHQKHHEHRTAQLVGDNAPFQFNEAYKSLRTNLEFLSATGDCKAIVVTSSVPNEGKSNVSINLAITLATAGKRVALIDCDLRKGTLTRYLHIPHDHKGLSNLIASRGEMTISDALVYFKDTKVTVVPAGTTPPNPSEMLSAPVVANIISTLKQAYDYIVIDTPPVTVVTDAAIMSRVTDGVLLVARPGLTTVQGAQLSKKNLEAVNARILGVVLNGYDAKKAGKKDGYYYSYSYGYDNDKKDSDEQ